MKRWIKIVLGVLLLLLLAGAALFWWQKENLKALKDGLQYSSEEIETKLQENQQTIKDAVDSRPEVVVRDVTEEERAALREGSLSQEELVDRLINSEVTPNAANEAVSEPTQTEEKPTEPAKQEQTPPQVPPQVPAEQKPTAAESEYQKKLSAIIAEVYVLREQYTIELERMFAEAKAEYAAMPEAERTKTNLIKVANGYLKRATALEDRCDDQMDDVVIRLRDLIRKNNGDMSIVDTVVHTYASEKSLKKAWYMSELEKRGLVL